MTKLVAGAEVIEEGARMTRALAAAYLAGDKDRAKAVFLLMSNGIEEQLDAIDPDFQLNDFHDEFVK
jgi:hypothetical protein